MPFIALILFLLLSVAPARAAFLVPGFELVVTDPVDTTLINDDIRDPTEVWGELIDGAKKSLDFEQQYAASKADAPFEAVMQKLEKAGERGIKIRFLLEEGMLRATDPGTLERLKKIKGLQLRLLKFSNVSEGGIIHAKYFVVDGGEKAYMGSQNFDWRSFQHIQETGLLVSDKKVAGQMREIFDLDWKAAQNQRGRIITQNPTKAKAKERAYLVAAPYRYTPRGIVDSESELVRLIGEAKDELRVTVLDYYPLNRDKTFYSPIDNALRAAQARHVKIKLLVSHWNTAKPGIDHLKSLSMLPGVEIRIATLPLGKEGFIPFARVNHSKYMVIDGKTAWVGTSNWSGGYFDKTRSLEIVVRDEKLAGRLTQLHEQLWTSHYSAALDSQKDYPKPNKGGE